MLSFDKQLNTIYLFRFAVSGLGARHYTAPRFILPPMNNASPPDLRAQPQPVPHLRGHLRLSLSVT
jgi:hypothetical protein